MGGDVAQPGERLLCKQEARGSNPLVSTNGRVIENCIGSNEVKVLRVCGGCLGGRRR